MLCRILATTTAALGALFVVSSVPHAELHLGDQAPPIRVQRLLHAPPGTGVTPDDLRGHAVVLEFFATWCYPCVQAIPRLNELDRSFRGQPIRFILITDESESIVKRFLKKRPIDAWIGLNPERSLFDAYGVTGIPATVLLDRKGIVRGRTTRPEVVTEEVLRALLADETPHLPSEPTQVQELAAPEGASEPLLRLVLQRSTTTDSTQSLSMSAGRFSATRLTDKHLLANAFHVSPARIVFETPRSEERYDVEVVTTRRGEAVDSILRHSLEAALGVHPKMERQMMNVLELCGAPRFGSGLRRAESLPSGWQSGNGVLEGAGLTPNDVARAIEGVLGEIVVSGHELRGRYDLTVHFSEDGSDFKDALSAQTGLNLCRARRRVEVLMVR